MATGQDLFNALQYYHPGVDLSSSGLMDVANSEAANGVDPATFASKYAGSPQVGQAYHNYYNTLAAPSVAATNAQIGVQQNAQQLSDQQYTNSANTENNDVSQSIANINRNKQQQNDQIFNQAAASGNTTAGGFLVGENNNNVDTQRNISYTEANRANALAQLALQNVTNKNQIQGSIDQLQGVNAATNQNTAISANNAFLQNTTDQKNAALEQAKVAATIPYGRTIQVGPYAVIQGMQTLPTQLTDFVRQNVGLIGTPAFEPLLKAVAAASGITLTEDQANGISSGGSPAPSAQTASSGSYSSPPPSAPASAPAPTDPAKQSVPSNVQSAESYLVSLFTGNKKEAGNDVWKGNDAAIMGKLQRQYGLSGQDASSMYYTIRKGMGLN